MVDSSRSSAQNSLFRIVPGIRFSESSRRNERQPCSREIKSKSKSKRNSHSKSKGKSKGKTKSKRKRHTGVCEQHTPFT